MVLYCVSVSYNIMRLILSNIQMFLGGIVRGIFKDNHFTQPIYLTVFNLRMISILWFLVC